MGVDKVEFWLVFVIGHLRTNTNKGAQISGYYIPSIGFGTWTLGNGQGPIDQVEQALENGYNHIGKSLYHLGTSQRLPDNTNPIA